jgi:hypothetical protein
MLAHVPDPWLFCAAVQIVISALVRRSNNVPSSFKMYIYLQALSSPLAALVFRLCGNGSAYFYTFYATTILTDLLTFLFVYEVYYSVFGPRAALPLLVPQRAGAMVAMAFTGAAALAVSTPVMLGGQLTHVMIKMEQVLTAAAGGILILLIIYSLRLHIAWPRRIAGLTSGFVLYLTIDVFAVFVRARGGEQVAAVAGEIGKLAYLLTLLCWTAVLWRKESASLPITLEQAEIMKEFHRESLRALADCVPTEGQR